MYANPQLICHIIIVISDLDLITVTQLSFSVAMSFGLILGYVVRRLVIIIIQPSTKNNKNCG